MLALYFRNFFFFNLAQLLRAAARRQKPWENGDGASYRESSQSARSHSQFFFFQMFADVGIFLAVFFHVATVEEPGGREL